MFAAVERDDVETLTHLVQAKPYLLLASLRGMSVLRFALMLDSAETPRQSPALLLNHMTLLTYKHGVIDGLPALFADALDALCSRTRASSDMLASCFHSYVLASGTTWIANRVDAAAADATPVAATRAFMQGFATRVLGDAAECDAVQRQCDVWVADIAMMAAAKRLNLGPVDPTAFGRGRQVANALADAVSVNPNDPRPLYQALRNLTGSDVDTRLDVLEMLLDRG